MGNLFISRAENCGFYARFTSMAPFNIPGMIFIAACGNFFFLKMFVWVKSIGGEEQALKVVWTAGNVSGLKRAITLERQALCLPGLEVLSVRSKNSSDDTYDLGVDAHVPIPKAGEIGSTEDLPYFFTIKGAQGKCYNFSTDRSPFDLIF